MTSTTDVLRTITRERVVHLAHRLCSVKQTDGREGPLAAVVAELLEHRRIDIHVDPVLPGRPNVIARVRGTGTGPSLLLNGHLDAGYAPHWSRDPHNPWVVENRMYGAGISDMLGGLASMMAAVEAAAQIEPLSGDLVLLANMHHDSNGLGTKYALATGDEWPEYAINGEPTSNTILTAHGGCVKFEIIFKGRLAHVSRLEEGIDALAAAADVYQALRILRFAHEPHPILTGLPKLVIGEMRAGSAPALVPDEATLRGDLRTVPGMSWATVRADLERLVTGICPPQVNARVNCLVRQRAFVGRKTGPLCAAICAGHRLAYNTEPAIDVDVSAQSFVTDAVDMAAAGIESVIYGPAAWHYQPDEYIDIDEMTNAARVYLAAALHLMSA